MSLPTVLVGEFWADDGDYDEPDGDRPDERVAGSGGEQDQSNGSRDADETWSASGVPAGQGVPKVPYAAPFGFHADMSGGPSSEFAGSSCPPVDRLPHIAARHSTL